MSHDELEELLPDLLYGELDEERAADVREQIEQSDELAKKLASYEALRGAFRQLPEEEPPSFISAQLLHEAAKRAPAAAASPTEDRGVWATITGWFSALSARPSLAAAMSLAVLVGVGSMVYFRGGDEIAQPNRGADTASPPPETERPPSPAVAAPAGTVSADPAPAEEGESAAFEQDGFGAGGDSLGGSDLEPTKQAPARRSKRAQQKKAETKSKGSSRSNRTTTSSSSGRGSGAKGGAKALARPKPKPAPPPPPAANKDAFDDAPGATAPAPEPAPDFDEDVAAESAPSRDKAPADEPASPSKVKGLHDRAAKAAKAGDCTTARKLGGQIEALDSAYYRDVFTRDSRIKACLAR